MAESQITVWVAEGQTVRDIVALTGLQEGSVYRHLRRACHKLGIARQVDLVRLVLSFAEFGSPRHFPPIFVVSGPSGCGGEAFRPACLRKQGGGSDTRADP